MGFLDLRLGLISTERLAYRVEASDDVELNHVLLPFASARRISDNAGADDDKAKIGLVGRKGNGDLGRRRRGLGCNLGRLIWIGSGKCLGGEGAANGCVGVGVLERSRRMGARRLSSNHHSLSFWKLGERNAVGGRAARVTE
jgi:hypothetical protein